MACPSKRSSDSTSARRAGIDVMLDVVRIAIGWRSVGQLAKEGKRVGMHAREAFARVAD